MTSSSTLSWKALSKIASSRLSSSIPSRKALSKIASSRLQKELAEWQVGPPAGFKYRVSDNLQRWVIEVGGAAGTLYAGKTYQLQVDFPDHYPMEAPQVLPQQQKPDSQKAEAKCTYRTSEVIVYQDNTLMDCLNRCHTETKYEKIRKEASAYIGNPLFPASIATQKLCIAIIIVFLTTVL